MDEKCPFLGLDDDPGTSAIYPTGRNRCYRFPKSRSIALDQQSSFCLSSNYPSCPIYQSQQPGQLALPVLPDQPDPPPSSSILKNPFFWPVTIIFVAFLAIIGLFFYARSIWGSNLNFSLFASDLSKYTQPRPLVMPTIRPKPTSTRILPLSTSTPTLTPTLNSTLTETPAPTLVASPVITVTPISTGTVLPQTKLPSNIVSYPTATICRGTPYGWTLYIVRPGDTLSSIAVAHSVSVAQLQSVNCMGSSTSIFIGSLLYIPDISIHLGIPTNTPIQTHRPTFTSTPILAATDTPVPVPTSTP